MHLIIMRKFADVRFEIQLGAVYFLQGYQGLLAHAGGNMPYLLPFLAIIMAKKASGIPADVAAGGL
eukprot:3349341-Pyramimonas_sp.AAC.1